jgi:imidazolonepropionase
MLIKNIKELVGIEDHPRLKAAGKEMSQLKTIKNAWVLTDGDYIRDYGTMPGPEGNGIDASGCLVFPSFCDSHTHLVYSGSREIEYVDKIRGLSYEEIAKRGGGILNSAKRLHETSEEELIEQALPSLNEIIAYGTVAVEIKRTYPAEDRSHLPWRPCSSGRIQEQAEGIRRLGHQRDDPHGGRRRSRGVH